MTDIALAIEALVPGAAYRGSVARDTRDEYDAMTWLDDRPRPAWEDIVAWVPQVPVPTPADVKAEAARRLQPTDWYVVRAADPCDGSPVPQAVADHRAAIRAASEVLEAMEQIPVDYAADFWWP